MFQFVIKDWTPDRSEEGIITGWTLKSSTRYTVQIWPGRSDIIGIEREKNTAENDPPKRWPDVEKKIIKVVNDSEYCYKLQKTQIRAIDGATGLYNFLKRETEHEGQSCFLRRVVEYAMDEMREAKTA